MSNLTVYLKGGLGNMMFQVATALAYSIRYNKNLQIDLSKHHCGQCGSLDLYKKTIFNKLNFVTDKKNSYRYFEPKFSFSEIPFYNEDVSLEGYFQSEKYFHEYSNEIYELFYHSHDLFNKLKEFYSGYLVNSTCSLHVRRGDYINLPQYHPTLSIEYYKNAINKFDNDTIFFIFSDDIEWCKTNFNFINKKIFVESLDDYEQVFLMSLCKDNIIANSTFSWWGAWLNKNKNKVVIAPEKWFGPSLSNNESSDLIPNNWIKI